MKRDTSMDSFENFELTEEEHLMQDAFKFDQSDPSCKNSFWDMFSVSETGPHTSNNNNDDDSHIWSEELLNSIVGPEMVVSDEKESDSENLRDDLVISKNLGDEILTSGNLNGQVGSIESNSDNLGVVMEHNFESLVHEIHNSKNLVHEMLIERETHNEVDERGECQVGPTSLQGERETVLRGERNTQVEERTSASLSHTEKINKERNEIENVLTKDNGDLELSQSSFPLMEMGGERVKFEREERETTLCEKASGSEMDSGCQLQDPCPLSESSPDTQLLNDKIVNSESMEKIVSTINETIVEPLAEQTIVEQTDKNVPEEDKIDDVTVVDASPVGVAISVELRGEDNDSEKILEIFEEEDSPKILEEIEISNDTSVGEIVPEISPVKIIAETNVDTSPIGTGPIGTSATGTGLLGTGLIGTSPIGTGPIGMLIQSEHEIEDGAISVETFVEKSDEEVKDENGTEEDKFADVMMEDASLVESEHDIEDDTISVQGTDSEKVLEKTEITNDASKGETGLELSPSKIIADNDGDTNPIGTSPIGTAPLGTSPTATSPIGTSTMGTGPTATSPIGYSPMGTLIQTEHEIEDAPIWVASLVEERNKEKIDENASEENKLADVITEHACPVRSEHEIEVETISVELRGEENDSENILEKCEEEISEKALEETAITNYSSKLETWLELSPVKFISESNEDTVSIGTSLIGTSLMGTSPSSMSTIGTLTQSEQDIQDETISVNPLVEKNGDDNNFRNTPEITEICNDVTVEDLGTELCPFTIDSDDDEGTTGTLNSVDPLVEMSNKEKIDEIAPEEDKFADAIMEDASPISIELRGEEIYSEEILGKGEEKYSENAPEKTEITNDSSIEETGLEFSPVKIISESKENTISIRTSLTGTSPIGTLTRSEKAIQVETISVDLLVEKNGDEKYSENTPEIAEIRNDLTVEDLGPLLSPIKIDSEGNMGTGTIKGTPISVETSVEKSCEETIDENTLEQSLIADETNVDTSPIGTVPIGTSPIPKSPIGTLIHPEHETEEGTICVDPLVEKSNEEINDENAPEEDKFVDVIMEDVSPISEEMRGEEKDTKEVLEKTEIFSECNVDTISFGMSSIGTVTRSEQEIQDESGDPLVEKDGDVKFFGNTPEITEISDDDTMEDLGPVISPIKIDSEDNKGTGVETAERPFGEVEIANEAEFSVVKNMSTQSEYEELNDVANPEEKGKDEKKDEIAPEQSLNAIDAEMEEPEPPVKINSDTTVVLTSEHALNDIADPEEKGRDENNDENATEESLNVNDAELEETETTVKIISDNTVMSTQELNDVANPEEKCTGEKNDEIALEQSLYVNDAQIEETETPVKIISDITVMSTQSEQVELNDASNPEKGTDEKNDEIALEQSLNANDAEMEETEAPVKIISDITVMSTQSEHVELNDVANPEEKDTDEKNDEIALEQSLNANDAEMEETEAPVKIISDITVMSTQSEHVELNDVANPEEKGTDEKNDEIALEQSLNANDAEMEETETPVKIISDITVVLTQSEDEKLNDGVNTEEKGGDEKNDENAPGQSLNVNDAEMEETEPPVEINSDNTVVSTQSDHEKLNDVVKPEEKGKDEKNDEDAPKQSLNINDAEMEETESPVEIDSEIALITEEKSSIEEVCEIAPKISDFIEGVSREVESEMPQLGGNLIDGSLIESENEIEKKEPVYDNTLENIDTLVEKNSDEKDSKNTLKESEVENEKAEAKIVDQIDDHNISGNALQEMCSDEQNAENTLEKLENANKGDTCEEELAPDMDLVQVDESLNLEKEIKDKTEDTCENLEIRVKSSNEERMSNVINDETPIEETVIQLVKETNDTILIDSEHEMKDCTENLEINVVGSSKGYEKESTNLDQCIGQSTGKEEEEGSKSTSDRCQSSLVEINRTDTHVPVPEENIVGKSKEAEEKLMERDNTICQKSPCPSTSELVQLGEKANNGSSEGKMVILPDLNASDSPALPPSRSFTEAQKIQLRAQIVVYGALMEGKLPNETYMAYSFEESERSTWCGLWSAFSETLKKRMRTLDYSCYTPSPSGSMTKSFQNDRRITSPQLQMSRIEPYQVYQSPSSWIRFGPGGSIPASQTNQSGHCMVTWTPPTIGAVAANQVMPSGVVMTFTSPVSLHSESNQTIPSGSLEASASFSSGPITPHLQSAQSNYQIPPPLLASVSVDQSNVQAGLTPQTNYQNAPPVMTGLSIDQSKIQAALISAEMIAKEAARIARLASEAALNAKLQADEAVSLVGQNPNPLHEMVLLTPIRDSKGNNNNKNDSVNDIVSVMKQASRRRVDKAVAASKHAENMDSILGAAELAVEAVKQVGLVVTMGDPLPFDIGKMVEACTTGAVHSRDGMESRERGKSKGKKIVGTAHCGNEEDKLELNGDDLGIKKGSLVEIKGRKEGQKGAWFGATVLNIKNNMVQILYTNPPQQEEWVPLESENIRVAHKGTSLQYEGIRKRRRENFNYSLGDHVDAWMQDAWWEGVITDKQEEEGKYTVHFPGGGQSVVLNSWNLRCSLVWKEGKWIEWGLLKQKTTQHNKGDSPVEKRQKVGPIMHEKTAIPKPKNLSRSTKIPVPVKQSTKDKSLNTGTSTKERETVTQPEQKRPRTCFGIPKPNKRTKYIEMTHVSSSSQNPNPNPKFPKDQNPNLNLKKPENPKPKFASNLSLKNNEKGKKPLNEPMNNRRQVLPRKGQNSNFDMIVEKNEAKGKKPLVETGAKKNSGNSRGEYVDVNVGAAEVRRSNRRVKPTSRLLEGLESSNLMPKTSGVGPTKGATSKKGPMHK